MDRKSTAFNHIIWTIKSSHIIRIISKPWVNCFSDFCNTTAILSKILINSSSKFISKFKWSYLLYIFNVATIPTQFPWGRPAFYQSTNAAITIHSGMIHPNGSNYASKVRQNLSTFLKVCLNFTFFHFDRTIWSIEYGAFMLWWKNLWAYKENFLRILAFVTRDEGFG